MPVMAAGDSFGIEMRVNGIGADSGRSTNSASQIVSYVVEC